MPGSTDPHSGDRKLLGYIAGGSLAIIGAVAVGVIFSAPDDKAVGLLGVIVGGLLVNGKDTIGAIKERWLGQQVQRMSDQISAAPPPAAPPPASATEAAAQVADAAVDRAEQIGGTGR